MIIPFRDQYTDLETSKRLKELGVESKDIQTANYNVYPQYDYTDGKSALKGYQVSQNVTVKIRNLDKADQILGLAGEVGVIVLAVCSLLLMMMKCTKRKLVI